MSIVTETRSVTRWGRLCGFFYRSRILKPLVATRRGRRNLVIANAVVLLTFTLATWSTGSVWGVIVLIPIYFAVTLTIGVATGGVLDKPMRSLDERQRQARRSLFSDPYATGAALGLVGGLVIAFSLQAEDALALGVFMTVFGALFGLPSMLMAWSTPEVDDEDE